MKPPISLLRVVACFLASAIVATIARGATVSTVAGTGTKGYSGDGGPASSAQLNNVYAIARGPDGYLYLCDVDNARVRRIGPDGKIETYAGSETKGYKGDGGPATKAMLNMPYELAWDKAGNLYFVELGNHVVRRVDAKTRTRSAPSPAPVRRASVEMAVRRCRHSLINHTASRSTRPVICTSAIF